MKNKMMLGWIGLLVIAVSFMFFAFKSAKQESEKQKTIMVEIYEVPAYPNNGIHIYYGNGKSEDILFNSMKLEDKASNGDLIVNTINRLENEGYEINHVGSGLANSGMIVKIFMTKK